MLKPAIRSRSDSGLAVLTALVVVAVLLRPWLTGLLRQPAFANWSTIFVAIALQAMPFLVLGVAVSASVAVLVPPGAIARMLPKRPALAVPVACGVGAALPGCECGSVPIAARLMAAGVTPPAALAFLLSAPAINPVVLVSTAVAFPGHPVMVLARLVAGALAATATGLVWRALGRDDLIRVPKPASSGHGGRLAAFLATAQQDFVQAGGFLVIGAAAAATVQTALPRSFVGSLASVGILALGVLAVLIAICSEADAFVAAGLTQFSLTARLAFLTVGPMVDLKLIALQAGTFGRGFAWRFSALTFVAALAAASLVGWWLL